MTLNRKRFLLGFIFFVAISTVIGAYAGTIGVNNLYGFTDGYGFTNLNSTNVNADKVLSDNVTISNSATLGSITRTEWTPTGITAEIGANSNNPSYVTDGTADDVQIQAALDAGETRIFLNGATFNLADEIVITGQGSTTGYKQVFIYGNGMGSTVINGNTGDYIFKIINAASPVISAMTLDTHAFGLDAIFGDDGGASEISLYFGGLKNLRIIVDAADKYGIYLQNPIRFFQNEDLQIRCNTAGTGGAIHIEETSATITYGDSSWSGYIHIRLNANNLTGVKLSATGAIDGGLMQQTGLMYITELGARTGLTAMDIDDWDNCNFNVQVEDCDNVFTLNSTQGVIITSPYIGVPANGVLFNVSGFSSNAIFHDMKQITMSTGTLIVDGVTVQRLGTIYENIFVGNNDATVTFTDATKFRNFVTNQTFSENSDTDTISNGETYISIPHGLMDTPKEVLFTWIENPGVANYWWSGQNATHFNITLSAGSVGNNDLKWWAGLNEHGG